MKRLLPALLLLWAATALADPGIIVQESELKADPYSDAATLATLPANTRVEVSAREGGWYRVTSGSQQGWVRMVALRLGDGSAKPGDSGVGSAAEFMSSGRSGSSGVTVATGVRGLDSADVSNAKPDYHAVDMLQRIKANPQQARRFAAQEQLQPHTIAYLPAPKEAR